jgi:aminomethyltransferase
MAKRTPLHGVHIAAGAKMIEFAGWEMPVQYTGVLEEHRAVRCAAGLFDLSHMGELVLSGPDALATVQAVTSNDASGLEPGQAQYSLLCRPEGGIVDDVLVYRRDRDYYLVVNAANVEKDTAWLSRHLQGRTSLTDLSAETALIAVQGPQAAAIVQQVTAANLADLYAFEWTAGDVAGHAAMISRTGYTGEDGFELFLPASAAQAAWQALLEAGKPLSLQPVGLGARDTLRLEARLTLYGNDIDESTTPLEAGLGYFVRFEKGDFIGRAALLAQKERGVERRLVAFVGRERGIPRHGYSLVSEAGEVIGKVTSGSFAPTLQRDIGLGYVQTAYAAPDTCIGVDIRGKVKPVEVIKGRFVQANMRRRP